MAKKKIAILADSGTDVPPDFAREHGIFIAPLKIIYKDREYEDRVDITPQEIYDNLAREVPRTSLPDSHHASGLFNRMAKKAMRMCSSSPSLPACRARTTSCGF